eukprot:scaffold492_cov257-Pinguiococcus_pyrenoidosus.AAC.13
MMRLVWLLFGLLQSRPFVLLKVAIDQVCAHPGILGSRRDLLRSPDNLEIGSFRRMAQSMISQTDRSASPAPKRWMKCIASAAEWTQCSWAWERSFETIPASQ